MPLNDPETCVVEALLPAVAAGDAAAIAAWYRREHPDVYRLALGLLADPVEAEDLAQDAMLHLIDRLDGCTRVTAYRAWRNKVLANMCRDRRRRRSTRLQHETRHAARIARREAAASSDTAAEQAEIRAQLTRALEQLTEREREVFVLRDLEQCSSQETAVALGIREGTVRSLLSLARRRLRQVLGPDLVEHTA
jgi:RNA polymerase sigma-70 factor (ECF subfamily)